MNASTNARRTLLRLYRDRHGYDDAPDDERRVREAGSDPMYGELMPAAASRLFEALDLGPRDTLYDLGSGIGKLAVQAAIERPLKRVVGIEMIRHRHDIAADVLDEVDRDDLLAANTFELWCGDFMRLPLADATIVYTCSTAFPETLMKRLVRRVGRLPKLRRFVSLRDPEEIGRFELVDVLRLDTSWKRNAEVFVYAPR